MLRKGIIGVLFLLLAFSGRAYAAMDSVPQVKTAGRDLFYEGRLLPDGLERLKAAFGKSSGPIDWLVINSGGGEIGISMDIGLWVHSNGLNVKVVNACLSSCANYIFPAGKHKVISANAIVGWHGSAIQESFDLSAMDEYLNSVEDPRKREEIKRKLLVDHEKYIANMKQKQRAFFETIDVDEALTVVGQSKKYQADDFWFLSVEDMARFGVNQVTAPENYPETDVSRFFTKGHSMVFIKLEP
jgi:hypothetical protein